MGNDVIGFKADLILEYLMDNAFSKDKAIVGSKLVKLFNLHDGGELRRIIHWLRLRGKPIISCNKGYFYSTNKDDLLNMVNNLYVRADGIFDIIKVLEELHSKL